MSRNGFSTFLVIVAAALMLASNVAAQENATFAVAALLEFTGDHRVLQYIAKTSAAQDIATGVTQVLPGARVVIANMTVHNVSSSQPPGSLPPRPTGSAQPGSFPPGSQPPMPSGGSMPPMPSGGSMPPMPPGGSFPPGSQPPMPIAALHNMVALQNVASADSGVMFVTLSLIVGARNGTHASAAAQVEDALRRAAWRALQASYSSATYEVGSGVGSALLLRRVAAVPAGGVLPQSPSNSPVTTTRPTSTAPTPLPTSRTESPLPTNASSVAPVAVVEGTVRIQGDESVLDSMLENRESTMEAIQEDLRATLDPSVEVTDIYKGSIVVVFTLTHPSTGDDRQLWDDKLARLAAAPATSWMVATTEVYSAEAASVEGGATVAPMTVSAASVKSVDVISGPAAPKPPPKSGGGGGSDSSTLVIVVALVVIAVIVLAAIVCVTVLKMRAKARLAQNGGGADGAAGQQTQSKRFDAYATGNAGRHDALDAVGIGAAPLGREADAPAIVQGIPIADPRGPQWGAPVPKNHTEEAATFDDVELGVV